MVDQQTTLESRPIDWFRPYERNARTHDEDQVTRLAAVITQVGFRDPIEVTPQGDIIAGHGRLEAARRLGLTEALALIHHDLTAPQVAAYRIANNRIAELSKWDDTLLAREIRDLEELGDLPELGFDDAELARLAKLIAAPQDGEDEEGGASAGLGNPVISYVLVFDNSDQQDRWFDFVRYLRTVYPGGDLTVAAMLNEFITVSMQEAEAT